MKQVMDKLQNKAKNNKNIILFLGIISLIGIIFGAIFIIIISHSDQTVIKNYIENFMNNISKEKINYVMCLKNTLLSNLSLILIIWLLGISIIGIPIIIFIYFSKNFILGFSVGSFILKYKLKGAILAFGYIFPHHIINIIIYTLLMIYALKFSFLLLHSITKKRTINFKSIMNIYIKTLIISIIGIFITALYESFIVPNIINYLSFIIK